jgi:hypothetical protein
MNVDDNGCSETSIALDKDGYAHISYRAYYSQALRYATNSPVSDAIAPTISITGPTSSEMYSTTSGTLTLSGSASDNVAVTGVTWQNAATSGSGTASGTWSWYIGAISLAVGDNVITVTAVDAAANAGTDTITVTYSPDVTLPTVQIMMPNSLGYVTTNMDFIILGGQASDDIEVTSVTWSNAATGGSGTATGTIYWETASIPLDEGSNLITVTAQDSSGNTVTDTIDVTYTPTDTTDPEIAITEPTTGSTYDTDDPTLSVSGTSSDIVCTHASLGCSPTASATRGVLSRSNPS